MAKRVQRRRGSTSEHSAFTGAEGEITVDTTIDTLVVHDGSTPGGHPLGKADGSNLNLTNAIGIIQLNVADGQAGWFLQTNGAGTLSFAAVDVDGTALGGSKLGGTIGAATIDEDAVGVFELNVDEGTAGYFLKTDGAGGLSFAEVVTDPTMGGDIGGITSINYINTGAVNPAHLSTPLKTFTVDDGVGSLGVDTFPLTAAPGSVNAVIAYIDGVVQPPSAYGISTNPNQITFTEDPPVGAVIRILHLGFQSTVGIPSDGTITNAKLATNSVESDNIVNLTIATDDIANDAITEAKIAAQTITEASITPNTITNISIANATVTGTQIADNAVDGTKISIAGNQQGDIMSYDGTNWVRNIAGNVQGDLLYYNGTSWVRLPAGTATHVLTTTGAGANPYWAAGSSGTALPAVGADGNVLTSDGTNWASALPGGTFSTNASNKIQHLHLGIHGTIPAPLTDVWTKPVGVTHLEIELIGAGQSGANNSPGTFGTGGGYVKNIIDVSGFNALDWTVGAAPAASPNLWGGLTTFGSNGTCQTSSLTVVVNGSGVITAITFTGGGTGQTIPPIIVIEPNVSSLTGYDGQGAVAVANLTAGVVTSITVTNGGSGYVSGQVNAWFGLGAGSAQTPKHWGNLGNFETSKIASSWLYGTGYGGAGEPSGGGGVGAGGAGGLYIKEYR